MQIVPCVVNVYESLFLTKMIDNILSMLTEPAAAVSGDMRNLILCCYKSCEVNLIQLNASFDILLH